MSENLYLHALYLYSIPEYSLKNLSIRHTKLKLLEFRQMRVRKFYLNSKSLAKLVLVDLSYSILEFHIHCPNLGVFYTNNVELLDIWGIGSV